MKHIIVIGMKVVLCIVSMQTAIRATVLIEKIYRRISYCTVFFYRSFSILSNVDTSFTEVF